MGEKIKTPRTETFKDKRDLKKPRQFHTPEGPAEEFIGEYSANNPPPPQKKK